MNKESFDKVKLVAIRLKKVLNDNGINDPIRSKKASVDLNHLLWMLDHIIENPNNEDVEKLNRWIGWIQCAMSEIHVLIDAEKERNETRGIFRGNG